MLSNFFSFGAQRSNNGCGERSPPRHTVNIASTSGKSALDTTKCVKTCFCSHQNVQKTNFFKLVCHVSLQPEALQRLPQRRGAGHMCHGQTLDRPPQICEKKHAGSHGHCSTSSPRGKNIASGPPNSLALSIRQYWNPHGHVLFTFHKSTPLPNENPFEK